MLLVREFSQRSSQRTSAATLSGDLSATREGRGASRGYPHVAVSYLNVAVGTGRVRLLILSFGEFEIISGS